jgi:hypothetical protein
MAGGIKEVIVIFTLGETRRSNVEFGCQLSICTRVITFKRTQQITVTHVNILMVFRTVLALYLRRQ